MRPSTPAPPGARAPGEGLSSWVEALAGTGAAPAGGALAWVTLAGASALAAKLLRLRGADPGGFEETAQSFLLGADSDVQAYAAARRGGALEKRSCVEAGLDGIEQALLLLGAMEDSFDDLPPELEADLAAAVRLAACSARVLLVNAAFNLGAWGAELGRETGYSERLQALRARLEAFA